MNIFMPEIKIVDSVRALDDKRLIKQILECYQIIKINDRVRAGEQKVGYANHPVVKFYRDKRPWLVDYGYACCDEYYYRFNKLHKCNSFFTMAFAQQRKMVSHYKLVYVSQDARIFADYSIPSKELTNVQRAFRNKLVNKWMNDKRPPKWTDRKKPEWYL